MFTMTMNVRDYECDLQGVVNNAVYQNYFEHGRHQYLHHINVDFAGLAAQGIHLMVLRAEVDYKNSLRPGDAFTVSVELQRASRIKYLFVQEIRRQADDQLMAKGVFTGVAVNQKGRPFAFEAFDALLAD